MVVTVCPHLLTAATYVPGVSKAPSTYDPKTLTFLSSITARNAESKTFFAVSWNWHDTIVWAARKTTGAYWTSSFSAVVRRIRYVS